jgi:putative ABC transport system permease protein
MRFQDLIYLVGSNLLRMKARAGMTATGVMIGAAAVILLLSIGLGLQRNFSESIGKLSDLTLFQVNMPIQYDERRLGTRHDSDEKILNRETIAEIQSMPGVMAATPRLSLSAINAIRYRNYEYTGPIVGIDPQQVEGLGFELASGEARLGSGQVFVGAEVGPNFSDPRSRNWVRKNIDMQGKNIELVVKRLAEDQPENFYSEPVYEEKIVRLRVAGVLEKYGGSNDYSVFLPLSEIEKLNAWNNPDTPRRSQNQYLSILVKTDSPQSAVAVEKAITAMGFSVDTPRKILEQMSQFFVMIQAMMGGVGAVALLVAAFGIANTMVMAIYERTQEIGLLKSLGARNADVMLIFLAEAGSIGLIGGIGGILAAAGLAGAINSAAPAILTKFNGVMGPGGLPGMGSGMEIVFMPGWLILFAIFFSVFIGMVSGMYPAIRAASLDPLEALRHE